MLGGVCVCVLNELVYAVKGGEDKCVEGFCVGVCSEGWRR